jgi:hypothetical protein
MTAGTLGVDVVAGDRQERFNLVGIVAVVTGGMGSMEAPGIFILDRSVAFLATGLGRLQSIMGMLRGYGVVAGGAADKRVGGCGKPARIQV